MMHIKKYTIVSFVWMGLVGWYVYAYITPESYAIDFFGIPLPALSIALLVIVPIAVLYVASVFHMWFYSVIANFQYKKYEKDFDKLIDAIAAAYLGKEQGHFEFKTQRYKMLGKLLENTKLEPLDNLAGSIESEKLNAVLEDIKKVSSGKIVDLKQYNLNVTNPLRIANEKNKYALGALDAEQILANKTKYAKEFVQEVFVDFVQKAPLNKIERYHEFMSLEAFYKIVERINADKNRIEITNEKLLEFIEILKLGESDYLCLAKHLSTGDMIPEQRIKLFEMLSEKHEDAMQAYLFTLYDLEMLSQAAEILNVASQEDYKIFRAYKALRDCGHNFDIKMFV